LIAEASLAAGTVDKNLGSHNPNTKAQMQIYRPVARDALPYVVEVPFSGLVREEVLFAVTTSIT
jgi:hypothetical protein